MIFFLFSQESKVGNDIYSEGYLCFRGKLKFILSLQHNVNRMLHAIATVY